MKDDADTTEVSESPPKRQRRQEPQATHANKQEDVVLSEADAKKKAMQPVPVVELQTPKVFIGGLHRSVTNTHVEKLMSPYGTIVRVHLVTHPDSGASKGFAFCQYERLEEAAAAVAALDGRALLGKRILVKPAHEQARSSTSGLFSNKSSSAAPTTAAGSTDKERRSLESKIQAIKRKLQETQTQSTASR